MAQYEIGQFHIPDRQLVVIKKQSRGDGYTDIGVAKITHSIFGRAKVSIIREKDKIRRAWLLAALALTALAAAAWLGWIALQHSDLLRNDPAMPSVSIKPSAPPLTEDIQPESESGSAPQQPLDLKVSDRIAERPKADRSSESKPQTESHAADNQASQSKTGLQPRPKPSAAAQPAAPALPASQPAEIKPAAAASPIEPATQENTPIQLPAGNN